MSTESSPYQKPWENTRYGARTRLLLYIKHLLANFFSNPLIVKHRRTRMRRQQLLPTLSVVGVLCLIIAYGGFATNGFAGGGVYAVTIMLQGIILGIMGATQISSSVGGARESGIIDYHRVSPMTPLELTLGFFFGAPVREYLLYAITLPLSLVCVFNESPSFQSFLETTFALFISAWVMHALSLLTALTTKKPKMGGRGVIGLVIFLFFFGGGNFGFFAFRRLSGSLDSGLSATFFGVELPWLLYMLLFAVPLLVFLLLAAVRKMRSERAHALTKPEAITALSILSVLLIGTIWGAQDTRTIILIAIYILVIASSVLIATVTPSQGEYAKGIRRAAREGKSSLSPWSEWSLNRATVVVFAIIVLAASSVVTQALPQSASGGFRGAAPPSLSYSITVATAVFVVLYVGFAFQAFQLMMPKRGASFFALFLFLAWLVPLTIGAIMASSGADQSVSSFILSLSPVAGLALASGVTDSEATRLFQVAVFCPAMVFAFVFNNLVVIHRRKIEAAVKASETKPLPAATEAA